VDNSFKLEDFQENFKIHLISCDDQTLVFDMVGVEAPIANALRRILIAEVSKRRIFLLIF
jgi:DNA-directed RNA polymerase I and III subunit RPAC1